MKKKWAIIVGVLVVLWVSLLVWSRSPLIVDDVRLNNKCPAMIENAEIIHIVPFSQEGALNESESLCQTLRQSGAEVRLHGLNHSYHEFAFPIDKQELEEGIAVFEDCLGEKPTVFRPPYNVISKENEQLVASLGMQVYKKRFFMQPYCSCDPEPLMRPLNWLLLC